jgi:predicted RNA-binding Zn-ribbon protein involved in translation (DUF1610 family)
MIDDSDTVARRPISLGQAEYTSGLMSKSKLQSTPQRKSGPGEYLPDPTQAIERIEDLPQPIDVIESRNVTQHPCPKCRKAVLRHHVKQRTLHDVGDLVSGRPREIRLTYSQHHCRACGKYFSVDTTDLAPPQGQYTYRVMALAVRTVVEDGMPYREASWRLWRDHRVFVPFATIQNWVEAGGKKGVRALRKRLR